MEVNLEHALDCWIELRKAIPVIYKGKIDGHLYEIWSLIHQMMEDDEE